MMHGQITKVSDLFHKHKAGAISDEQIEFLYGVDVLNNIMQMWQEELYGSTHYA